MNKLFEVAIVAYRDGRYLDAADLLLQVTDADATNWLACLYLAMAYKQLGRIADVQLLLHRMWQNCPDQHLRNRSKYDLMLIEAERHRYYLEQQERQKLRSQTNELLEVAILAYRAGRYRDAVDLLLQVADADATHWLARLYLAMAYQRSGRIADAQRLLQRMSQDCLDEHLRSRAKYRLTIVEAEMCRIYGKVARASSAVKTAVQHDLHPHFEETAARTG